MPPDAPYPGKLCRHQLMSAAQANSLQFHQYEIPNHGFGQIGMLPHLKGHIVEYRQIGKKRPELKEHTHLPAHLEKLIPSQLMHDLAGKLDITR